MVRHKFWLLAVMIFSTLICGCATFMQYGKLEGNARRNYQCRNYDLAVSDCTASLRLNPNYGKAQVLIKDVFRMAVDAHESKIKELKSGTAKFKWDDVVSEYEALIKLNGAIKSLPPLVDKKTKEAIKFEVTDYSQDMSNAKTNAAEAHYQEGIFLSQNGDSDSQKQAAKEFKACQGFCPDYKDSASLYERSRKDGVKRIAIIPFEDKTGKTGKYGSLADIVVDDVISDIMKDSSAMEFLEIVSRDQLMRVIEEQDLGRSGVVDGQTAADVGKVLGVHEIVTGKINQIIYVPSSTTSADTSREKSVASGTEKYTDSNGKTQERTVYKTVHATLHVNTRASSASITGSYSIIDVKTAKLKKTDSFSETDKFECQWATYSGDERALDSDDKKYGLEMPAPIEEEMVNRAAKKLSISLAGTLKNYAR